MEAMKYCEGGYLEQWEAYMKFLQKTINRKLCILELGVSMRFPGVIRNAFEKTAYYNQKAKMFRIHQRMFLKTWSKKCMQNTRIPWLILQICLFHNNEYDILYH